MKSSPSAAPWPLLPSARVLAALPLLCGLLAPGAGQAQATPAGPLDAKLRLQWDQRQANATGPLAQADALQPGTVELPVSAATAALELRTGTAHWNAIATLQHSGDATDGARNRAWFNELAAQYQAGDWVLGAGRKIVAWDVGYAFRPNDVVQQQERQSLVSTTLQGRGVLMAERFTTDAAWSLVWVNPTHQPADAGVDEPALAARLYQRHGDADWHAFARVGAHTGASAGLALAWVAGDALELHSSVRALQDADVLRPDPAAVGLVSRNPWRQSGLGRRSQVLVGGTWTHASQFSVLAEAWWDGTAATDAQWQQWQARQQMLTALPAQGAPAGAVAGNLAWQAQALSTLGSLQQRNMYLRLSWEHAGWQPALDLLYHPADGGRLWTAALRYQGERLQLQCGWRTAAGPAGSLLRQLPTRQQAYVSLIQAF